MTLGFPGVLALALAVAGPRPLVASERQSLDRIRALLAAGKYDEAEGAARAALDQAEATRGPESAEAAEALPLLVESLRKGGKSSAAETVTLGKRSVAVQEKRHGPDHPLVATSLNELGDVHAERSDFTSAEPLYTRALAIQEKAFGPEAPAVAAIVFNLAEMYVLQWQFAKARPLHERALAIRLKTLGPVHVDIAKSLYGVGTVLHRTGDSDGALSLYERALAMFEKSLGVEHPTTAQAVDVLAILRFERAEYAEAQALFERALAVGEKVLGPGHPRVAATANNFGDLLTQTGDYAEAKRLYERALESLEKSLGPEHPTITYPLNNLAVLLREMGDLGQARVLLERALAIQEKALGPEDAQVAYTLNHLGSLLSATGDDAAARALLERALAIREKAQVSDHVTAITNRVDLGALLLKMGELQAAERHLEAALASGDAHLGADHPATAETLRNLALLRARRADPAGARRAFERSLSILERASGRSHPKTAEVRRDLASLLARSGDKGDALAEALRAEEGGREHLRETIRGLSERQALLYARARTSGLDIALTLLSSGGTGMAGRGREVLDALVRSRAVVLDEMAARHRAVVGSDDPEIAPLARAQAAARGRLARLVVRGPGSDAPENHRKLLESARRDKERAEQALAGRSLPFREEQARARVGLDDVAQRVRSGAALVSFVRFVSDLGSGDTPPAGGARYLAFVLRGGETTPTAVLLGAAEDLERVVARWRKEVLEEASSTGIGARRAAARYRQAALALRRAAWDPVARELRGVGEVYVVPDGALNLVNFAALPLEAGPYLAENGPVLQYLSAERDLAHTVSSLAGSGLLAVGSPAFDAPLSAGAESRPQPARRAAASRTVFRGPRSLCSSFEALRFPALPSSRREVDEISALWGRKAADGQQALLLRGHEASEAAFKELAPGRRFLHLATHGFFIGERCAQEENPMLRAGLALAGANHRARAAPGEEDGILTAEEVGALDLQGTEWTVLSACDTGLGDLRAGEGVLGLRRAFRVAGVKTTILSLWPVEDDSVREWMQALYRERFVHGRPTALAVHEATLDVLRSRRKRGVSTHPFHWAGFVATGDAH